MLVELSKIEVHALIDWHRENKYQCANKEEYTDAEWHKSRLEELINISEHGNG